MLQEELQHLQKEQVLLGGAVSWQGKNCTEMC
jgi:hypothetical protein